MERVVETEKNAVITYPERELWLHRNQDALQAVQEGLLQAKKGQLHKNAINLDIYPNVSTT